jgi:hypothetical protein
MTNSYTCHRCDIPLDLRNTYYKCEDNREDGIPPSVKRFCSVDCIELYAYNNKETVHSGEESTGEIQLLDFPDNVSVVIEGEP